MGHQPRDRRIRPALRRLRRAGAIEQPAALITRQRKTLLVEQRRHHDHAERLGEVDGEIAVILGVALHPMADHQQRPLAIRRRLVGENRERLAFVGKLDPSRAPGQRRRLQGK